MREPATRRRLLAAGLAGAGALALAPAAAPAAASGQGAALTALVRAEEDAAFVYLSSGLPGPAGTLAAQEDEHARALAAHLQAIGLPIPEPARSRRGLHPAALAVLEAGGDGERLRAAIAFEQALIDGCAGELARLEEPGIVRTVATIMASHAQHLALHRRSAGLDPFSSGE